MSGSRGSQGQGWVAGIVGAVIGAVAIAVMFAVTDAPKMAHTSALSALFDDRLMLSVARLLTVVAALYVVASIGVRVRRGQWVRSAGAVQTDAPDAPVQQIADDQEDLQRRLEGALATIEDLTGRLERSLAENRALTATMEESGEGDTRSLTGESGDDDDTTDGRAPA